MRFFFLPLVSAEIICNYDEPCLKACTDTVCDYYWNIEHRYSRTWRTKDYGSKGDYPKGAYRDFPIFWNKTTNSLDIIDSGISTGVEHIYNEDGTIKDPLDDLENLFLIDGQEERRAITIRALNLSRKSKIRSVQVRALGRNSKVWSVQVRIENSDF